MDSYLKWCKDQPEVQLIIRRKNPNNYKSRSESMDVFLLRNIDTLDTNISYKFSWRTTLKSSTQKSKALKCFSSFIILILITLAVSVHASAAVGSVMTDSARIDRFTYNATTKCRLTAIPASKSMLLADGWGTIDKYTYCVLASG